MVSLPQEPLEATEAQAKFERLSEELVRVYPFIEETRAVAKSKEPARIHVR